MQGSITPRQTKPIVAVVSSNTLDTPILTTVATQTLVTKTTQIPSVLATDLARGLVRGFGHGLGMLLKSAQISAHTRLDQPGFKSCYLKSPEHLTID